MHRHSVISARIGDSTREKGHVFSTTQDQPTIKVRNMQEDTPLSFVWNLLHFHGTVLQRIYPQLLLVVAVAVFCYLWDQLRGGLPIIDIPNYAHAIFGTPCYCACFWGTVVGGTDRGPVWMGLSCLHGTTTSWLLCVVLVQSVCRV